MKRLALIGLIGLVTLAGCSLFTPAQQQIGQQVVATGAAQASCIANQGVSTLAAWSAQNPGKQPTGTQVTGWAEDAAFTCMARYPMILPVPAAVPAVTPAS